MKNNLIQCDKRLEDHPKGIRDDRTGIVYDNVSVMTGDIGCDDCLDVYKCKYAQKLMSLI